jgi:hypothetical protein
VFDHASEAERATKSVTRLPIGEQEGRFRTIDQALGLDVHWSRFERLSGQAQSR